MSMRYRNQPRRPWARRAVTASLLPLAGLGLLPATASAAPNPTPGPSSHQGLSADDSEHRAALVAAEDRRLNEVRAVGAVAPAKGGTDWSKPYRLNTGGGYTLVLTQQSADYTIADLLRLAPETFVRQKDGSYLLTENIYVNGGAKLTLSNPGGLTIRMASNSNGFVSIVSFGGSLKIDGTPQAPTVITSWDPRTGKPDTDVSDGRAYIRAIGGQFEMSYAKITSLGFWSGRTGGLSLTGTDRPNTGNVDGPGQIHLNKDQRHQAKADRLSPDGPAKPDQAPSADGVYAQPSGPLVTPDTQFAVPDQSYVSGKITQSTITDNAFGLFISSANGINISDVTIQNSRNDGLVMHRFASSAVIERTTSRNNGHDGFVLSRATREIRVSGSTASGNGGNGFTLSGQPLAKGPSASGESTASYGSNSISNSYIRNNGHYGVEILGGLNVGVQNNEVVGGDMGIVARQGADQVAITGNRVHGQRRQGIAVRDGVTGATVTGNIVENTDTGIYVRDSAAEVRGNTVHEATNHGVTLLGDDHGSLVSYNVIAGVGPSAIDTSRSTAKVSLSQNQTFAWHDTSSFWIKFRHYASPMTLLWTGVLVLILFSAAMGRRRSRAIPRAAAPRHPYADKIPLQSRPPIEVHPGWVPVPAFKARARVMSQ